MTCYCKYCMHPSEESVCPVCGSEGLEEILPEDPCFLMEQQSIWAGVLEDVLRQKRIPHMKQPARGAGMTAKLGSFQEMYRFFVPYEYLSAAQEAAGGLFSETEIQIEEN